MNQKFTSFKIKRVWLNQKTSILISTIIAFLFINLLSVEAQPLRRLQPKGKYGKPNIILFVADNFTFRDVEIVKKSAHDFPNLSKFITNSITFTQFYNSDFDPQNIISSYLFGIHPGLENTRDEKSEKIIGKSPTLATILKNSGYWTGAIGNWRIGKDQLYLPNNQGFDQWFGYLTDDEATNAYPSYLWRNDKKWQPIINHANIDEQSAQHWFVITTTNFLRIYREYPFFLYLPSILPGKTPVSSQTQLFKNKEITDEIIKSRQKNLKSLDSYIGNIFNYLEEFRISDKTVIIFTSLVKEGLNSDTQNEKKQQFKDVVQSIEQTFHVPLFVLWEGTIKINTVNHSLLSSYDLFSTIADLADSNAGTNNFKYSIANILINNTNAATPEFILWKINNSEFKWIIKTENYFAGLSEETKRWHFQYIDNIKVTKDEIEKQALDFLIKSTNHYPRIKVKLK
ncbi:MAG: sulfatase-like hydrolase/transferase [Verrucomicrobiae bacterium]|nr:sulfatase-like hydrolase/transferase [Verrucomicrobiae bacterium]